MESLPTQLMNMGKRVGTTPYPYTDICNPNGYIYLGTGWLARDPGGATMRGVHNRDVKDAADVHPRPSTTL